MPERKITRTEFFRAFREREIQLHYQPICDSKGRPFSHEALLRWKDYRPYHVINRATDIDLIDVLTLYLLCEVCQRIVNEKEKISFNCHVSQIQGILLSRFKQLYKQGFPSHHLEIELTENSKIDEYSKPLLARFVSMGYTLSLDDLGTGHTLDADLTHISTIKIDRSLIQSTDIALEERVRERLKSFGCKNIVAEGVETLEHLDRAKRLGAGRYQGWLFGKAIPLEPISSAIDACPRIKINRLVGKYKIPKGIIRLDKQQAIKNEIETS